MGLSLAESSCTEEHKLSLAKSSLLVVFLLRMQNHTEYGGNMARHILMGISIYRIIFKRQLMLFQIIIKVD
jgi:hypothetical protein